MTCHSRLRQKMPPAKVGPRRRAGTAPSNGCGKNGNKTAEILEINPKQTGRSGKLGRSGTDCVVAIRDVQLPAEAKPQRPGGMTSVVPPALLNEPPRLASGYGPVGGIGAA